MKKTRTASVFAAGLIATLAISLSTNAENATKKPTDQALSCWNEIGSKANLEQFDDLDFNVFSNQKWDQLHKSHAKDIIVHWPDGRTTTGIDVHIDDLKALFVYAPDTRIKEHPIQISCGNLTAVSGIFEGTFTEPMPIGNGKTIAPTGKAHKMPMATIGRWENGAMVEEWLFWDNKTYLDQIGLGQ